MENSEFVRQEGCRVDEIKTAYRYQICTKINAAILLN